ncbi:MAG: FecR domain-containing protein [Bdellovibrionaceae bacterium]|nr:FecR domain-containing protein [Bdellovibrionales bacterium]MCB9084536.1 FecR domain-containing protein [Pseudobdellovibrionaceae bacterium]
MTKIFLILIGFILGSVSAVATECGRIESFKGKVEVLRVKSGDRDKDNPVRNPVKVTPRFKVDCQDVVLTQDKARAKVRLKGNIVLTLGANSRMSIEEYAKKSGNATLLHLTYGKMRALFNNEKEEDKKTEDQKQKDRQSKFRIRTSTAVAGVRGTDFYVSFEPNTKVTEQATISGEVQVEQVGTGQKVNVPAGNQVAVEQVPEPSAQPESMVAKGKQLDAGASSGLVKSAKVVTTPVIVKKLEVKPIDTQLVAEIRQTSVLVKADEEFTHKEAVEVLGAPEEWKPAPKEMPFDLKDLREEF